ncbi:MAG: hypothetical protein ACHQ50_10300 [Fimbriimonadales bacterium]
MLRVFAITLLLVPGLLAAQNQSKLQNDRTRVLDVAASTPFFTKRGADAVKRVIAGGQARNIDERVLAPLDEKPGPAAPNAGPGQPPKLGQAPQGQPQAPAAPAPEPKFGWRLAGISYGSRHGLALFQADGKSISVGNGSALDPDTKIVAVSKSIVVLDFHGKRLALTPW